MSETPQTVGYGRPPVHTRFQKGRSGNPGGKAGPEKRLKRRFRAAVSGVFEGDRWELKDARPRTVMEALARKVALDALDGRASAQRLLLSILDGGESEPAESTPDSDEQLRQLLGDRYDAYRARFDIAVAKEDRNELAAIAKEIDLLAKFPS